MASTIPRLEVLHVCTLTTEQKTALFEHLASSAHFNPSDAQHNYGDQVSVEVMIPADVFHRVRGDEPSAVLSSSIASTRGHVSFVDSSVGFSSSLWSPTTVSSPAHVSHAPAVSLRDAPTTASRSCQWLHKVIDDVYSFRLQQFRLTLLDTSSSAARDNRAVQLPSKSSDDLSISVYRYLSKKFGVPQMIKKHASELLEAVRVYRCHDIDVQLFGLLLGSQAYDTEDVLRVVHWRSVLLPYAITQQEVTSPSCDTAVMRRFLKARDIPALVRKCLVDRSLQFGDAASNDCIWQRVRAAMPRWCDPMGRFPSVVPDPNFYCPPFRPSNPYVGNIREHCDDAKHLFQQLLLNEGRFCNTFQEQQVVHFGQVLLLMLLCSKAERLKPSDALLLADRRPTVSPHRSRPQSPPASSRTPRRHVSPSATPRTPLRRTPQRQAKPVSREVNSKIATSSDANGATDPSAAQVGQHHQGTTVAMVDVSPGFNPFSSPRSHAEVASPPGGSPSLREEEEQFHRDLAALEKRLAHAIHVSRRRIS